MTLEEALQKHLESAITHGYNDAQTDNDGLGEVCRMEAQQNLRNAVADVRKWVMEMVAEAKPKNWGTYKGFDKVMEQAMNDYEAKIKEKVLEN